jgi:hypothetical protein
VVLVGLTDTAVPLVTEILPGVITPVPLEKFAVRLELAGAVIVAGLAVKLEMLGGVPPPPPPPLMLPPPQPATPIETTPTHTTAATETRDRFMALLQRNKTDRLRNRTMITLPCRNWRALHDE